MNNLWTLKEKIISEKLLDNSSFFYGLNPYYNWNTNNSEYTIELPSKENLIKKIKYIVPNFKLEPEDIYGPKSFQEICYISRNIYQGNSNTSLSIMSNNSIVGQNIHWIWYRKKNSKFSKVCGYRVYTWIRMNPELSPILWTDMENESEFEDFISDQEQYIKDSFKKIKVMYKHELINFINNIYNSDFNIPKNDLLKLFDRWQPEDMMVKTDVVRTLILYHFGGFYSDFNDTICFIPLRYVFQNLNQLIIGSDTNKWDANNYFMYSPKGNEELLKIIKVQLANISNVLNFHREASKICKQVLIRSNYEFMAYISKLHGKFIPINVLCFFLKEHTLHAIANSLKDSGISKNLIEILICHPEMFRKILQIHIWTLRQIIDNNLVLNCLIEKLDNFCQILENSYCNTTNVTHSTTNCYFLDKDVIVEYTNEFTSSDILLFKKLSTNIKDFNKYFANNTQHVCMKYTNAGIIANTEGVKFHCHENMYILRTFSLISAVCHIGTGSAAGDDSKIYETGSF